MNPIPSAEEARLAACASCESCVLATASADRPIPYEVHVTVENADVDAFRKACTRIGIKPLVLALHLAAGGTARDVMTSSVHFGDDDSAKAEAARISGGLAAEGFKVVRAKIETAPWHPEVPTLARPASTKGRYFEAHLAVECASAARPHLEAMTAAMGLHLSRNAFKTTTKDVSIIMATKRVHDSVFETFKAGVDSCRDRLVKAGFRVDKVIVEYAIFDTAEGHDSDWIGLAA